MNLRTIIPLLVIALAAYIGWREYDAGRLVLPGIPPARTQPSSAAPTATPSSPAPSTTAPSTTAPSTTAPSTTSPSTTAPSTTTPSTTAPSTTAPSTRSSGSSASQRAGAPDNAPGTAQPGATSPAAPSTTPPGATPSATPPASSSAAPPANAAYPELSLREPDVNPAVNLREARARVLESYDRGDYADAIALADAWLNAHPSDALVAITRGNALRRQLGQRTVTIGVSTPTSGPNAPSGEAVLQGVNLAVQEANAAGGIRGRPVLVNVRNDQNDRALAVKAATALLNDRDVLGVIGPVGSSAVLASAGLYNTGLVQLAPTATDDRIASAGPYTYRLAPGNAAQGKALARLAKARGFTRVPVYYDASDAYGKSLADAFITEAQRLDVSAAPFTFATGELPGQDGFDTFSDPPVPDAAFIAGTYNDTARIAKALRAQGFDVPLLAGDAAYSQALLSSGGDAVEGLTLVSFFHAGSGGDTAKAFTKAFAARYGGGTPNARAAQAYDAARTLIEAIRRADAFSRDAVKTAMTSFRTKPAPGVMSPVRFDANGGIIGRPFVVIQVKDGRLVATGTTP